MRPHSFTASALIGSQPTSIPTKGSTLIIQFNCNHGLYTEFITAFISCKNYWLKVHKYTKYAVAMNFKETKKLCIHMYTYIKQLLRYIMT